MARWPLTPLTPWCRSRRSWSSRRSLVEPDTPVEELPEDLEGARLVALNMALNGTPREETDRYLAENFDLDDRQLLLDEVYASVAD